MNNLENPKLTVELVPSTCWFSNVRSEVSESKWSQIRKNCYRKANYRCEICGGRGDRHPVECHEIWYYDELTLHQVLQGFIALCPSCHEVKHPGLAKLKGRAGATFKHLKKINNWDTKTANKYLKSVWKQFEERSKLDWVLDISYLDTYD